MQSIKYGKLVDFVHLLLSESYSNKENLDLIDATCGNGLDTLFLCNLAGKNGRVKAFDIQKEAIYNTSLLLKNNLNYINYELILDSHEFIPKYINKTIDAAVFNLGYLPLSDKTIKTNAITTINAIDNLINLLNENGRIFITSYITHDKGYEINQVAKYLSLIDKSKFSVLQIKLINKNNNPPELFIIEKMHDRQ